MKKKVKQKQKNPPLSGFGQCTCTFSRSEGKKKWLLGFCLFFENDWTYEEKTKKLRKRKLRETIAI